MDLVQDSEHNEFKYVVLVRKEELVNQLEAMEFSFHAKNDSFCQNRLHLSLAMEN